MMIDGPSAEHVCYVAENMREADIREFLAISHATTADDLASGLVSRFSDHPEVFCFSTDESVPVAVGGMIQARPNVVTMMFFATDDFSSIALPLAKFTKQRLFPRYRKLGVHRIEAISIDGHGEAHRWIEIVGMKREGEPMRGYGKGGETYHQFAWVSDDVG